MEDMDEKEVLDEESPGKMERLYDEVNALKMAALGRVFQADALKDPERALEAMKHMRMALNAITVQLKILSEEERQRRSPVPSPRVEAIWNAVFEVPKLKPILSREAVRKKVLENLEEMMKGEKSVAGSQGEERMKRGAGIEKRSLKGLYRTGQGND